MIQMRWGDETVWKDQPQLSSVEEGYEKWRQHKAEGRYSKYPPDPDFRVKPESTNEF